MKRGANPLLILAGMVLFALIAVLIMMLTIPARFPLFY